MFFYNIKLWHRVTISRTYRLQKSYCLFCSITSGPRSSGVWNPTQTWKALNNIELKIWVKKRLALSYHPWEKYFCLWYSCAFQMVGWWFQCTWISQYTQSNCLAKQNSSRKKKSILLPKHTVFVSLVEAWPELLLQYGSDSLCLADVNHCPHSE